MLKGIGLEAILLSRRAKKFISGAVTIVQPVYECDHSSKVIQVKKLENKRN